MIKVVINKRYGGYSLSDEAIKLYTTLSGKICNLYAVLRLDPRLVKVVETLNEKANGRYAYLEIEEIPKEFEHCYKIEEYDGLESIDLSAHLLLSYTIDKLNIEAMDPLEC